MNSDYAFNEYALSVADALETAADLLSQRRAIISAAAHDLEDNDWGGSNASLFWQMVAGILLWRRPAYDPVRADHLAEAAEEVLEQAAIYGTIL